MITELQLWIASIVLPHRQALIFLVFAICWSITFVAPAFTSPREGS